MMAFVDVLQRVQHHELAEKYLQLCYKSFQTANDELGQYFCLQKLQHYHTPEDYHQQLIVLQNQSQYKIINKTIDYHSNEELDHFIHCINQTIN